MEDFSPERWPRVKAIAAAALDLDAADRPAYVERVCAGDTELRAEALSLVASAEAATPFFEQPGGGAAAGSYAAIGHLGPYRIIRELASGGMGTVYLAERDDGEFRQRVAIKIVRGGFGNAFLLDRFRAERRILASLEHPNIARLLDGGTTDAGLPYVVMEFVEGEPIDRFCSSRALSLRDRLAIFLQVCSAVEYAHQHLVIHRDIKAPNILVTADATPKLLDFGIAKLLGPDADLEGAHTTVHVMTPESASPEQVSGGAVGIPTDIYALGVLLHRILTGDSPYRSALDRGVDLTRAICEEVPDRPGALASSAGLRVPADVDMIVLKALRKEPERRYASAGQLSEDIQRFLDDRPVLASPDSLGYRTAKFVRRHRLAVSAAAALLLAIAGGVSATVWQARAANRERVHAQREFDAVRGLAQAVLIELAPAVDRLPGSIAAREIIIRRGTEYLDALAAEASDDDVLRREVAIGYLRLADVEGSGARPNIGDRDAARKSLLKSIAILEPLAQRATPDAEDRTRLAEALGELSDSEPDAQAADHLKTAHALLESLTPAERSTPLALLVRQTVWGDTANRDIEHKDFGAARIAQEQCVQAAEAQFQGSAATPNESRNLSVAYKSLGATLEMLHRRPEALALYAKALDLDERRVAGDPKNLLWRLDLSFSHGAIGAALLAMDDAQGARARYEEAVRLREAVVKEDPDEDFARISLARGYHRLAGVWAEIGDATEALGYEDKADQVYRGRLDAHPERANVWTEFTAGALAGIDMLTDLAVKSPSHVRAHIVARVNARLDELQAMKQRWTRDKHAGELPPTSERLLAARARLTSLK